MQNDIDSHEFLSVLKTRIKKTHILITKTKAEVEKNKKSSFASNTANSCLDASKYWVDASLNMLNSGSIDYALDNLFQAAAFLGQGQAFNQDIKAAHGAAVRHEADNLNAHKVLVYYKENIDRFKTKDDAAEQISHMFGLKFEAVRNYLKGFNPKEEHDLPGMDYAVRCGMASARRRLKK